MLMDVDRFATEKVDTLTALRHPYLRATTKEVVMSGYVRKDGTINPNAVASYPEITVYSNMKHRCYNNDDQDYHRYGGRGIEVCARWNESFRNFISDMGRRPTPKHQIDRIDNDGNYEPSNCRWVMPQENARHRCDTKLTIKDVKEIRRLFRFGIIKTKREISRLYLVSESHIGFIIRNEKWVDGSTEETN